MPEIRPSSVAPLALACAPRPATWVVRCGDRHASAEDREAAMAAMATGGLGLVQLLWDANRQAIQDKTAHTVVLDARAAAAGRALDR